MIAEDFKMKEKLNSSGDATVLSHFIWSAGHPIEATIKGMLCSLFHQLISNTLNLMWFML